MSDFLDQYLALKKKVSAAGSELTISIVIPEVNSDFLYSVTRLTDSDDPAEWIKAISDFVETDEYNEKLLRAKSTMRLKALDDAVDNDLRDIKVEVTAVDLIYFSTLALRLQEIINKVHQTNSDRFDYTAERHQQYINDVNFEQRLTESLVKIYRKDTDAKEEPTAKENPADDKHPL